MERKMKDSGIPWIGMIPEDWGIEQLSGLFSEHKKKNSELLETNLLSLSYGKIIRKDINTKEGLLPQSFDNYNVIDDGDIVFRLTDLQNDKRSLRTGLCTERGIITSAYITIRKRQELDSSFFHYLFHSYDICKVFYGLGDGVRQGMNYADLRKLLVLLPPLPTQQRIADFLDRKCAEIDELSALQETMIAELKRYKQSVITEAVTKGLDKNVKMKDSGVEWIGEIPEGWKETKVLNLLAMPITDGPHETPNLYDSGIPFISADAVSDGYINFDNKRGYISQEYYEECCKKYIPQMYDIYMIKSGASTGRTAIVETDEIFTIWSPLAVFRANSKIILPYFLLYVLRSYGFQKQVETNWSYGTQQNIGMRTLEKLIVSFPPLSEQQAIADYLDEKCSEIDELIAIKQQKIEQLKEYKKSVIFEYVTGKKEVL